MIARMVKVEIVGPQGQLLEALSLLSELGVFQIEQEGKQAASPEASTGIPSALTDEKTLAERIFYQELRGRIEELFSYLPRLELRQSYLDPETVLESVAHAVPRHAAACREWCRKKETLVRELEEVERYRIFLEALEPHLAAHDPDSGLEFIGVTVQEPGALEELRQVLSTLTRERFGMVSARAADGSLAALVTLEKCEAEKVRALLGEQRVPELPSPAQLARLPFRERLGVLRQKAAGLRSELAALDLELTRFAQRWGAIYARVRGWLDLRLALLSNVGCLKQTGMCFVIQGWTPELELARLEQEAEGRFGGKVVLLKKKILEQDLDQVPVTLRNPAWFRPFELFSRLLPLPVYGSLDPTPFTAVGFPLFFGMILGDAGYGLVLLLLSLILGHSFRKRPIPRDGARILAVCATFTIIFGVCYGEYFGELGGRFLGLKEAYLVERRHAVVPMLWFAISIGLAHVVLGLLLGTLTALKRRTGREAALKLVTAVVLLLLAALFLSLLEIVPPLLARPLALILLFLIPLLFYSGGLLAPLELVKNLGNVVSYARIMAIGLASVLLAQVANSFAGLTGNVVVGVMLAVLFHAVNLALGLFSPAIHALRLHYVEFYSKFVVPGGRRFQPLGMPLDLAPRPPRAGKG